MKIFFTNLQPQKTYNPEFCARTKRSNDSNLAPLKSDVVEITNDNKTQLPKKLEYTETERAYKDVMREAHVMDLNIVTQKQNLRSYYSAQDKEDYRELLKARRKLESKMKRMAKQFGTSQYAIEYRIDVKREYNYYASKIFRAKTMQELLDWQLELDTHSLCIDARKLLNRLIEQCKKSLKK